MKDILDKSIGSYPRISKRVSYDLSVLLTLCVLVRLVWVFTVPISEAPDEGAHDWVIQLIHQHRRLPCAGDVGDASYYGALPPFGYLPHVLMLELFSGTELALAARFGSVIMGMVLVAIAYYIARELFPNQRLLIVALPAVLVFHPQLAFIQAYSNNDSTAATLAAIAIYVALLGLIYGLSEIRCALFGICLAWLLLSKYTGFCVVPVLIASVIPAALLHKCPMTRFFRCALLSIVIPSVLVGAWFWHSFNEFNGDTLGMKTMFDRWCALYKPPLRRLYKWPIVTHGGWRRTAFMSFWGLFGDMNRPLPDVFYGFFALCVSFSSLGWLFASRRRVENSSKISSVTFAVWTTLALCCTSGICGLVASGLNTATAMTPPQGRYMFPEEIPLIAVMLKGLSLIPRPWDKIAIVSLPVCALAACLYAWFMLVPLYGISMSPMRLCP